MSDEGDVRVTAGEVLEVGPTTRAPIDPRDIEPVVARFGRSRSLPASAYTSPEVFGWEMAEVFGRVWVCLGRAGDLLGPGQARAVAVGEETVLVTHDGRMRGFSNTCRHRGHELVPVGEAVDLRLIRCPYHSWSYRLDGSLKAAPTFVGSPGFDPESYGLVPVRVAESLGWLFADLSGEAPELDAYLGNLVEVLAPYRPGELMVGARHGYEIAANWKIVVENYHECYHCTTIHPELCRVTPPDSGEDYQPTGMWCGGSMTLKDHAETMSLDGRSGGVVLKGLTPDQLRTVLYLGVFPNLLVSPHPDYVMAHRIVPLASDRSWIECVWLFPPEALDRPGFDPSYAVDFWDLTNREDWAACEGVQRGARNRGFRPGPIGPWESTVYQFLQMIGSLYLGRELRPPPVPASDRSWT